SSARLFDLIEKGAFAQLTASSVTGKMGKHLKKYSLKMIENNLIHLIASDVHEVTARPFAIKDAYDVITSELGIEYTDRLKKNAEKVLNGNDLITRPPNKIEPLRLKNENFFQNSSVEKSYSSNIKIIVITSGGIVCTVLIKKV